jgi:hypothetical protein
VIPGNSLFELKFFLFSLAMFSDGISFKVFLVVGMLTCSVVLTLSGSIVSSFESLGIDGEIR